MAPRPVSVGINPQIALYTLVLTTACAFAAYNEKYGRNQEKIDENLQKRYYAEMRDQREKVNQMTSTIRGHDVRLDGAMNKLVWGGKAKMEEPKAPVNTNGVPADVDDDDDMTAKKERKTKKRGRKLKKKEKEAKRKQQQEEAAAASQKLMVQSMAAGATIGAVAVAATVFLGGSRRR